jgi:predicted secreted protein
MAVNGTDILVYIGADLLGGQRDVTFDEATEVIDASSKASRNRRVLAGRYSSTLSLDALYLVDDAAYVALKAAMRDGTTVTVVRKEEGANMEQATAVVASLSEAGPDQDVATVSISFEIDNAWVELGT